MSNTENDFQKITKDEFLEKLKIDNGENYIPSDNRTYLDVPLSNIPSQDIEKRIALSKPGSSVIRTPFGNFYGGSSVETNKKSESLVLHYPKATNINMIFIKSFIGVTFYPVSLINRYDLKDFSIKHKINIYYSAKTELFYALFDERFLDNNPYSFIMNEIPREKYSIVKSNDKKEYLAISAKNIDEIKSFFNFNNEFFKKMRENYYISQTNFSNGNKVIVVRYDFNNKIDKDTFVLKNQIVDLSSVVFAQNLNFSFFKALEINNNFFILDENDNIDTKKIINIKSSLFNDERSVVIYNEYTDKDWDFINKIYYKYKELNDSIYEFFNSCKNDDKTFKQISNNDIKTIKLLGTY